MSGTAELAQDFFPVLTRIARRALPRLWDRVFPEYGAYLCPKPYVTFQVFQQSLTIGWPVLLVVALFGVIIGWGLGLTLFLSKQKSRGQLAWASSFLFFGLMNGGAIGYHCLPGRFRIFYVLDVAGTACSSFSIVAACLAQRGVIDDRLPSTKRRLVAVYLLVLGVVSGAKLAGVSSAIICELFYLIPMQSAGMAVLWLLFWEESLERSVIYTGNGTSRSGRGTQLDKEIDDDNRGISIAFLPSGGQLSSRHRDRQLRDTGKIPTVKESKVKVLSGKKVWLYMMLVSLLIGCASVSLDRVICRYQKVNWLAVVWIFVSCDVAFVFLFGYLRTVNQS